MGDTFYTNAHQRQVRRVFPELLKSRELLLDLVWKDIRVRYRYAALGFLWAILEPLFMMVILTFVFTIAFKARIEEYGIGAGREVAVFILCGLVPWQFFSTALGTATRSLVDNRNLIVKVWFPREVIPLSALGVALVNLVVGGLLLLVIFTVLMGDIPGLGVLWLPVIFAIQFVLVMGLALLFSAANAYFRDVAYMVETALLFGFYASPIFYPPSWVQSQFPSLYPWYRLNPMVGLLTSYRDVLFTGRPPELATLAWPLLTGAVALVVGTVFFRKSAATFADNL